jgi:glycine cleavage system H lipoate-binding protein
LYLAISSKLLRTVNISVLPTLLISTIGVIPDSSKAVSIDVKNPGDFVNADEVIARIETDKVTVDITAPVSGIIKQYFAKEGDTVSVGSDFY